MVTLMGISPLWPVHGQTLETVGVVGLGILVWYVYQIASRKQERLRYKLRRGAIGLFVYAMGVLVLERQFLPLLQVAILSGLAGMGSAWLLVHPPKR